MSTDEKSKLKTKAKSQSTKHSANEQGITVDGELTCSPCSREGRTVEATKYCEDCGEHLCEKCVHDHKKFIVTKEHKIVGKQQPPVQGPRLQIEEKCSSHEGKVLELFCGDHDELCCSVCVAVNHRGCVGVVYIPQAAVGVESCLELMEVKESVQQTRAEVDTLRTKREENQKQVQQDKEDIINAILDLRIRVSGLLDNLEREARRELQVRYNEMITKIDVDVRNCEDVSATLGGLTTKLDTTTHSEAELFVWLKRTKKSMNEGVTMVHNIGKNIGKEKLTFMEDRTLENVLSNMKTLGQFGEDRHVYKTQFEGEYNFSLSTDIGSSEDNTGSLCLPDGKLILTNAHHKRLKLLSPLFKVVDHVDLPGKPYAICQAGPNEVISSLREEKQLQFVVTDKKLKLSRTMKIGVACYGVACNNGEIFTACVGGQYENRPQVRVYNMSGRMLRMIEKNTDGNLIFSTPRNITLSPDGTLLHVTDREFGVLTLGLFGKVMSVYKGHELDSPRGITCDQDGNIFVCGQNSHNIVQLNTNGDIVGMPIKDKANLNRPQSVCFVQRKHPSQHTQIGPMSAYERNIGKYCQHRFYIGPMSTK